jgi:hypothetical protein
MSENPLCSCLSMADEHRRRHATMAGEERVSLLYPLKRCTVISLRLLSMLQKGNLDDTFFLASVSPRTLVCRI